MSLFGTDGVRGPAGEGPLSSLGALRLAACFAGALGEATAVAIARDTRRSGDMLSAAVVAGLCGAGLDVHDLGVLPTPALSWYLAEHPELAGGIMITASHNAWPDNGLKFFAAGGTKVADAVQDATASAWQDGSNGPTAPPGARHDVAEVAERGYLASLVAAVDSLQGTKVVVDTASGAAWRVLPAALDAAGAEVIDIAPPPTGTNINDGLGAVHPGVMAAAVVTHGAHAGIAVDGDGDRIMLADPTGQVHDGDAILGFLAADMRAEGTLRGGCVVGTKTTNSGLGQYLAQQDLQLLRSDVGDRHVAALMASSGANLGGETSGHVLTPDLCPTGDGSRVALDVLRRARGRSLADLLGAVPRYPVGKASVRVAERPPLDSLPALAELTDAANTALAAVGGRTLLRYSGTEPILRIQVEAPDAADATGWAERLAACARECIPS